MALEEVRRVLNGFIASRDNEFLVIKGKWGAGKTYFWRKLVEQAASSVRGHRNYAYVSLFGISSIRDLKAAIFVELNKGDQEGSDWARYVKDKAKALVGHLEKLPKIGEWVPAGVTEALAFLAVKDALICFDDFERRGEGLRISEVMGLISQLKDQRGCSVALILNEDSLEPNDRVEFRKHGEKLSDIEVAFAQEPAEAFCIVFSRGDDFYFELLEFCSLLGMANIRTLKRIKGLVARAKPMIVRCEDSVAKGLLSSVVLFAWCYYGSDEGAPPFEFVKGLTVESLYGKDAKREEREKDKEGEWTRLLQAYGYRYTDQLDLAIASYIQDGYFREPGTVLKEVETKNAEARNKEALESYYQVWNAYLYSFDEDDQRFVAELLSAFWANIALMSPVRLNEAVVLLRSLGRDVAADELIDDIVSFHSSEKAYFDLGNHAFGADVTDSRLRSKFTEALAQFPETRTLSDVVKKIARTKSWHPDDVALLAARGVEEYYQFFKSENSEELRSCVKACLRFLEYDLGQGKLIGSKAKEALLKIARESEFNRLRVSRIYGVDIEDGGQGMARP